MAKNKSNKTKVAASIHLDGPGRWTAKGRRDIAKWLHQCAENLIEHGKQLSDSRFKFSYHVPA